MKVVLDQTPDSNNAASATPATPTATRAPARASTSATAAQEAAVSTASHSLPAGTPTTNVTFRRDDQGRIYYVLTDAQSGKEIRQVPPEELRKVGEGIGEFLKQLETKATPRVETKA